jgi:polyisoprenoid-binding protein YceI
MRQGIWLGLCWLALGAQAADAYRIQPEQTKVSFTVRRFGVQWIAARFSQLDGQFTVDRQGPASAIEVNVRTDSLEGLDSGWNTRLRSKDWLDTQRYPRMTFRSSHVEYRGNGGVAVGQLCLHGVCRPVLLNINRLDCNEPEPGARPLCGFSASTSIRRSDFNLPHGFWVAGDAVEISVSGMAARGDSPITAASAAPLN